MRKSFLMVLIAGSIGLAAGCGSSSTSTGTSTPKAAAPSATTSASTSSSSGGSGTSNASVAAAVTKCKTIINAHSGSLSPSVKSKLLGVCNNITSPSGLKQALGQVCTQLVNSYVPSAAPKAIKDQALATCKKVSG